MRNDARPVGEDAHDKSPIDERESVTHDRQSPIVNHDAEEKVNRLDRSDGRRENRGEKECLPRQSPR